MPKNTVRYRNSNGFIIEVRPERINEVDYFKAQMQRFGEWVDFVATDIRLRVTEAEAEADLIRYAETLGLERVEVPK